MSAFQVSDWLQDRQITDDDTKELVLLAKESSIFCFGDITIDSLTKFYSHQTRDFFYRLIRILGFYGVVFSGKLAAYSGPQERYPKVLYVDKTRWQNKIPLLGINTSLTLPFCSCGIAKMKQLHGVPVQSVITLCGTPLSHEAIAASFPVTIVSVHDGFFPLKDRPLLSPKNESPVNCGTPYSAEPPVATAIVATAGNIAEEFFDQLLSETIENLPLSIHSLNCLWENNINFVGELVAKSDEDLLKIEHLGGKSLREIKACLWTIGLCTGLSVEKISEHGVHQAVEKDNTSLSVDTLNLSVRSSNCLRKAKIRFLSELLTKSDEELLSLPHFGQKSLREIRAKLDAFRPLQKQKSAPRFCLKKDNSSHKIDLHADEIIKKLTTRVSDLVLSVRSRGGLKKMNIVFLWQLAQLTKKELFEVNNLGRKSINELQETLANFGFWLGMKFTPEQLSRINAYVPTQETSFVLAEAFKEIVHALSESPLLFLNDRENLVVSARLFTTGKKQPLEELAQHLSLSRERVRQIEKSSIKKIRQHHKKTLRVIVNTLKQRVEHFGCLASLEEVGIEKGDFSPKGQAIGSFLCQIMDEDLFVDWDFSLVSSKGEEWVLGLCDDIEELVSEKIADKFFTANDLFEAVRQVAENFGLLSPGSQQHLINKFYIEKKVAVLDNFLCCGRVTKQEQIIWAFKELFPAGLDVYKKHDLLMQQLKDYDPESFGTATPRGIIARLTSHPDIFLWERGFFIHKDHLSYDEGVVEDIVAWIEKRFDQGHSRFQVNVPFTFFKKALQLSGIPNQYALYTLLRLKGNLRIGQRKYPTIVDLQADIDIQEGILEELENYFLQTGGPIPYSQLQEEFLTKRGWKVCSLQQTIMTHSEVIYPWQDNSYIHLDYMPVDYARLDDLLDAIRKKLKEIQGAYSLKGAKKEMNVLWEQACPSASVRTMIKLIRSVELEDLQIERYLVQLVSDSAESVSTVAEIEEFFLEKGVELNFYELREEFCTQRGWSDNQLYTAMRKARLFRSGKSTYLHPTTIGWNESLSQEIYQVMESRLVERKQNGYPYMQVEELIYQYALPELPSDILWTVQLLKSVSEEFGNFLFFDDAYIAVNNEFGIEDLDDMIGFLIGRHFRLGIAKREEVEQMLWREGILESGKSIPADQFFDESSILFLPESNEVGLSTIGWGRYGQSV